MIKELYCCCTSTNTIQLAIRWLIPVLLKWKFIHIIFALLINIYIQMSLGIALSIAIKIAGCRWSECILCGILLISIDMRWILNRIESSSSISCCTVSTAKFKHNLFVILTTCFITISLLKIHFFQFILVIIILHYLEVNISIVYLIFRGNDLLDWIVTWTWCVDWFRRYLWLWNCTRCIKDCLSWRIGLKRWMANSIEMIKNRLLRMITFILVQCLKLFMMFIKFLLYNFLRSLYMFLYLFHISPRITWTISLSAWQWSLRYLMKRQRWNFDRILLTAFYFRL